MKILNVIDILLYKTLLSKFYISAGVEYEFLSPEESNVARRLKAFAPDAVLLQDGYSNHELEDLIAFLRKTAAGNGHSPRLMVLESSPGGAGASEAQGGCLLDPDIIRVRRETLTQTLAAVKEETKRLTRNAMAVDGPIRRKRLLVADPSKTMHYVVKAALEFKNYDLQAAYDGEEAYAKIKETDFDLVLTSVQLPRLGGLELCRRIKEDSRGDYLPVVVLSSSNDPLDVDTAFRFGADDYLEKSFSPRMLADKVSEHLDALDRKRRNKILVVDESRLIRGLLRNCFIKNGMNVFVAENGDEALDVARREKPDVLVACWDMPDMGGYRLCRELHDLPETRNTLVVMMSDRDRPGDVKRGELLGVSRFFVKPFDIDKMLLVVEQLLAESYRQYKKEYEYLLAGMRALITALEARDEYTRGHTSRVSSMALRLGKYMKLDEEALRRLRMGANLHDIGKIGVSDAVLLKPGRLTDEEYAKIQEHAVIGAEILSPIKSLKEVIPLILYHHERWDGNGYPMAIRGEEIPLGARILSIADAYDAMTSDRPYRRGMAHETALKIIREERGRQFCPECADAFLNMMAEQDAAPKQSSSAS